MLRDHEPIRDRLGQPHLAASPAPPSPRLDGPSDRGISNLALLYSGRRIEGRAAPRHDAKA